MNKRSLLNKTLTQFIVCIAVLLILTTPLFYLLTKYYYAEDMIDIIEAVKLGKPIPALDLEQDIMHGIMIQFALITGVLGIAIVFTVRVISRRLWKPFDETLKQIEAFRLENGKVPVLPDSDVREFARLNHTLNSLMENSLKSYHTQKEFTENASHELQTPLAVFQSKLDNLLQQPDLTEQQAEMILGLYEVSARLSRLNRNLLLLAKIDNNQYARLEPIDIVTVVSELLPYLENLSGKIIIRKNFEIPVLMVRANKVLLESMINNLVVNAVRYNKLDGGITIALKDRQLVVSNTSDEQPLDSNLIFNRFYRPSEKIKGNGLGLAIVKAICDYHDWQIIYSYEEGRHIFTVRF